MSAPAHDPKTGQPREHLAPTPGLDIDVVHADETFVVVNKPAGMLSVPGRGEDKQDCARVRVEQRFPEATGSITCHRLDMDTSGLLVMALEPKTHVKLSRQFEKRRVRKWYEALLERPIAEHLGGTHEADGTRRGGVKLPQVVDWANRPLQKIDWKQGKTGDTEWIDRGTEPYVTPAGETITVQRVELRPRTGRTHQLRVHCAWPLEVDGPDGGAIPGGLGSPILGDRLYGDESLASRLCLHARRLGFWHPWSGDWVSFETETPF
ncbi:MAG: RluA family pseudouridine synthase [Planctomycetota bacterium]